jgi:hypothetical protein
MSLMSLAIAVAVVDHAPCPDSATKVGVSFLGGRSRRQLAASPVAEKEGCLVRAHSMIERALGSLSLRMTARLPNSRIAAVSNSQSLRIFRKDKAPACGPGNLTIVNDSMSVFDAGQRFRRIVSVESFEHMPNWRALLARTRRWLIRDGRLFLHVFTQHARFYCFEQTEGADWMAWHFFTGGVVPAHVLPHRFASLYGGRTGVALVGQDQRGPRPRLRQRRCGGGTGAYSSWPKPAFAATPAG